MDCDLASASCSLCGRYKSSIEKTRVGRLYGGDDRVLESVVTYLVSVMGCWKCSPRSQRYMTVLRRESVIDSYQCRLASALDAVEANKEWSRLLAF